MIKTCKREIKNDVKTKLYYNYFIMLEMCMNVYAQEFYNIRVSVVITALGAISLIWFHGQW